MIRRAAVGSPGRELPVSDPRAPHAPGDPATGPDPLAPVSSGVRELALTDDLTSAKNRRFLRRLFEREWQDLLGRYERITILAIDLDLFKEVNDRYGHLAGDVVLRAVATRLAESFRDEDRLIRYGGDEFVVVLPGAGPAEARSLAERARQALRGDRWQDPLTGRPIDLPVSFSIGVASAPADGASGDTVLAAADRRLYEEKKSRRLEAPVRRIRLARWSLVLAAAATIALTLPLVVDRLGPRVPAQPSVAVFEAREQARDEVIRRQTELAALRAELERLRSRPAADLSTAERARYEGRIRALESAVEADAGVAVVASTGATAAASAAPRAIGAAIEPGAEEPGRSLASATPAPAPPVSAPVLAPPQLISYEPPTYPQAARARGVEAELEIAVRVDASGRVVDASLLGPSAGFGLEEAALVAARSARYRPGTRDGAPAEMETTLRILFRMGDSGRR